LARVVALVPDLLFGSRVQAMLREAGHEVQLVPSLVGAGPADVIVVDLTSGEVPPRPEAAPEVLAFYSHVDAEVRERALAAGYDLVVPRSRMAREGGELVSRLAR
jgi:hypothetical protein